MAAFWEKLGAGFELDRIIARRIGWKVGLKACPFPGLYGDDREWHAIDPKGLSLFLGGESSFSDLNAVWRAAFYEPDGSPTIQHFSDRIGAALTLPIPAPAYYRLFYRPNGWHQAEVAADYNDTVQVWSQGFSTGAAHAICRAWLAWDDRHQEVMTKG